MANTVDKAVLKQVQIALQNADAELQDINKKIWSNPELAYNEYMAHDNICAMFENLATTRSLNYQVRRKTYQLDTSFEIEYKKGDGGRVLVFNAEYDALPGIGHACGHNLIATSSIAAYIATVEALQALDTPSLPGYTVRLLGTPAEEGGGGKLKLIEAGAYKGVDACLMVHPVTQGNNDESIPSIHIAGPESLLANNKIRINYTGSTAHAAGAPWEGINALDAVVSAYVNISLLRQQILPSQRVHGVIANGGERPNVIPGSASLHYYIRSPDTKSLNTLTDRVFKCFEGAATATGCKVEFEWINNYQELKNNKPICEAYMETLKEMGHNCVLNDREVKGSLDGASTDMGNVMHQVPGFHALFQIPTEDGAGNHTHGFTAGAGSPEGYKRGIVCATGMAVVGLRILMDDEFAKSVKADFEREE
ncbi:Peptidase M20 domain-containing protein 2 [Talaromyces pinophilus]|nr:Peptidase M20 domain-containing protein 2 [Talaromyces pinophilus]PCG98062.1 hypothetical protein PENOC_065160 [Penicillium occitanis (nom. inval.)]PCH05762.1 Peptidase M20D, amidohydrolase, predicted [Penicillium occitanis (nom. inval.)]